jgi:hypothetical protein
MDIRVKRLSMLVVAAMMLFSVSCMIDLDDIDIGNAEIGELQETSEVVELDDADRVQVDVRMGTGELQIDGGAAELLEADFAYNIAEWKPEVTYTDGRLVVRQPDVERIPFSTKDSVRYRWELKLNDGVPMDMELEFGAGDGEVNLGSLALDTLDVKLGAGNVSIDMSGNDTLERLELDMGAGNLDLDLRGAWTDDVYVNIQGGVGQIQLDIPTDIGVRVDATKGIGQINADGFRLDGGDYVNDAYGESDVTLNIVLQAGVGQINLNLD